MHAFIFVFSKPKKGIRVLANEVKNNCFQEVDGMHPAI
jgi:hypothetical protein